MEQNYIPQRGIDFDDFIGSMYFRKHLGLTNIQFTPVFCHANERHDDDFVGIRVTGFSTEEGGDGKYVELIAYPSKVHKSEDLDRLFDKVETEDGVRYSAKTSLTIDEVFIRVCYAKEAGKKDTYKWVSAVNGGEMLTLSGGRRTYVRESDEDAEV